MKNFLVTLLVIGIVIGLYYFIQSAKSDVVDPDVQFSCNEKLALMRFESEQARNDFYQDCLDGKIQ
jgi:hypothetical protein